MKYGEGREAWVIQITTWSEDLQLGELWEHLQVFGSIIGIFLVDKIGRRRILIQSSIQTFLAELALGIVFAFSVRSDTVILGDTPSIASISLASFYLLTLVANA